MTLEEFNAESKKVKELYNCSNVPGVPNDAERISLRVETDYIVHMLTEHGVRCGYSRFFKKIKDAERFAERDKFCEIRKETIVHIGYYSNFTVDGTCETPIYQELHSVLESVIF